MDPWRANARIFGTTLPSFRERGPRLAPIQAAPCKLVMPCTHRPSQRTLHQDTSHDVEQCSVDEASRPDLQSDHARQVNGTDHYAQISTQAGMNEYRLRPVVAWSEQEIEQVRLSWPQDGALLNVPQLRDA